MHFSAQFGLVHRDRVTVSRQLLLEVYLQMPQILTLRSDVSQAVRDVHSFYDTPSQVGSNPAAQTHTGSAQQLKCMNIWSSGMQTGQENSLTGCQSPSQTVLKFGGC